ncbi:hypothetical protein BGZ47_008411 [Haplosporangium gracile]|nr:hypothetical protein BGZ47_008411 [Haplosporangium gracile]
MDRFFDWLTDPLNHQRLYKKNPIAGQKSKDIHKEIAALVNAKHNLNWTEVQVKSKIAENLAANPSPPRQTSSRGYEPVPAEDTDEESSDIELIDDSALSDTPTDRRSAGPPSKRRKGNSVFDASSTLDRIERFSAQQKQTYDDTKADLRQREQAIEQRERELTERLFRIAEEARVRFQEELRAERIEFRKEMADEREISRQKIDDEWTMFRNTRDEFSKERNELSKERDNLISENAALRKELEILERLPLELEPPKRMLNLDSCRTMETNEPFLFTRNIAAFVSWNNGGGDPIACIGQKIFFALKKTVILTVKMGVSVGQGIIHGSNIARRDEGKPALMVADSSTA